MRLPQALNFRDSNCKDKRTVLLKTTTRGMARQFNGYMINELRGMQTIWLREEGSIHTYIFTVFCSILTHSMSSVSRTTFRLPKCVGLVYKWKETDIALIKSSNPPLPPKRSKDPPRLLASTAFLMLIMADYLLVGVVKPLSHVQ